MVHYLTIIHICMYIYRERENHGEKNYILEKYFRLTSLSIHCMVFTTEGLFEVAIEGWPEWDLNPRPLNSVQTL